MEKQEKGNYPHLHEFQLMLELGQSYGQCREVLRDPSSLQLNFALYRLLVLMIEQEIEMEEVEPIHPLVVGHGHFVGL